MPFVRSIVPSIRISSPSCIVSAVTTIRHSAYKRVWCPCVSVCCVGRITLHSQFATAHEMPVIPMTIYAPKILVTNLTRERPHSPDKSHPHQVDTIATPKMTCATLQDRINVNPLMGNDHLPGSLRLCMTSLHQPTTPAPSVSPLRPGIVLSPFSPSS